MHETISDDDDDDDEAVVVINKSDTTNNRGTRTISKYFRKYPNNIARKHIKELQKTLILGIVHIPWEVLAYKYNMFIMENNITCTTHCNHRRAATLSTIETWLVSGAKL
jgi:hypothetical protein